MDCILLGTGGMMPMPDRHLTSVAFRYNGDVVLFDAGEGVQVPFKKYHIGNRALTVVAITHLHADHCLGLPGMLMLRAQMPDPGPLTIVGPPGISRFVENVHQSLNFVLNYPIYFKEWTQDSDAVAYRGDGFKLIWEPLNHSVFCLGYRVEEDERPGKFNPETAIALGVEPGPLFGELQRGQTIIVGENTVTPEQVMGPKRKGRRMAFAVDTRPCKGLYRLLDNVDLAFVEGMFLPDQSTVAAKKMHMTVDDSARVCQRANVQKAVIVHVSPRYTIGMDRELELAAKARFEMMEMGIKGKNYSIPLKD